MKLRGSRRGLKKEGELFTRATHHAPFSRPRPFLMVLCLVYGDPIDQNFAVNIDKDEHILVSHLQQAIKKTIDPQLNEYPVSQLTLWKVAIPTNDPNALKELKLEDNEEKGVKKLYSEDEIQEAFAQELPKKHIHVIVVPPTTDVAMTNAPPLPYTPRLGGLGGTTLISTEGDRAGNYEGINLESSDICPREKTIQRLAEKIWEAGVLLVRSPPMSGKTSLGQLLEQHLLKNPDIRVIRISLLWMGRPTGDWTFEQGFQELMGITWDQFLKECRYIQTILIVDEVQMLYVPQGQPINASHHNGNVFWEVFKGCQQFGNLRIVTFAAYGYKGAWDCSSAATRTMDVSPYAIPPGNTWGLEEVRFTKEEYDDYILRFCKTHFKNMKDEDVAFLQDYVHNTTGRHPGLVAFFMNHIKDHFHPQRKYDDTLTFEEIFGYLKSHNFMIAVDSGFRGYLRLQYLTPEETKLCDQVFREPVNIRLPGNIDQERLIKTNLLSEQDGKLDFASPFLRALYLQRRWGSTIRSAIAPQDFKSFLIGTFTNMNAETIRNSYSTGKDSRLLERAWQMEFYRAATQVLPREIFISPDVGAHFKSSGYLDFWVDDNRCWAIELLRDGANAAGHRARFEKDGIYVPIRNKSKEWATIDIRRPGLPNFEPEYKEPHWISVYCQENWESVIIEDYDKDGTARRVEVQLMGGKNVGDM